MPLDNAPARFINRQSRKVYTLTTLTATHAVLTRVTDRKVVRVKLAQFREKYTTESNGTTAADAPSKRKKSDEPTGILVPWEQCPLREAVHVNARIAAEVAAGFSLALNAQQLFEHWGHSAFTGKCAINFYGPPGTGKTMMAGAQARVIEKPLYQVDYASVISKYVGDTAKHIKQAFATATELGAVLFFDEADSLLSRRIGSCDNDAAFATSVNQNRNVLMQEMDRFEGVVIFSTNLVENYDPAIMRRIMRHVQFSLPGSAERAAIFADNLGRHAVGVDVNRLVDMSAGLSGSDIATAVVNAFAACSSGPRTTWVLSTASVEAEVIAVQSSRRANSQD